MAMITLAKAATNPQGVFKARVERAVALAEAEAPEDRDRILGSQMRRVFCQADRSGKSAPPQTTRQ